jgi:hypothetical protein
LKEQITKISLERSLEQLDMENQAGLIFMQPLPGGTIERVRDVSS